MYVYMKGNEGVISCKALPNVFLKKTVSTLYQVYHKLGNNFLWISYFRSPNKFINQHLSIV